MAKRKSPATAAECRGRRKGRRASSERKIVAPKIGGVTLKDGTHLKADGQLAGTPSVLFDAVAIILSSDGCAELMKDGEAIVYNIDAWPLLARSGVKPDVAVVDLNPEWTGSSNTPKLGCGLRELNVRTLA